MKASISSVSKLIQLQQSFKNTTVKTFSAHNSKIHSVGWNVDGKRLASGSVDKTVQIFTFENREKLVESSFKYYDRLYELMTLKQTLV